MDVVIRHAEPTDAEAIHRIYTSPRVVWGTLQLPFTSIEQYRERLVERPEGHYYLVAAVDGEVVGTLGLHTTPNRARRRHVGSFGMGVRDDWQGRGIGSKLMVAMLDLGFNWLGLRRIEMEVFTDNAPAIALYKKFGFEIEGVHRAWAFRNGEYVDAYSMARLRLDERSI